MRKLKTSPADGGVFAFAPFLSPAETRDRIRGAEHIVVERLLKHHRQYGDWTGPFVVDIHRGIFGELFPDYAGRFRDASNNVMRFGSLDSIPAAQIDPRMQQFIAAAQDGVKQFGAQQLTRKSILEIGDAAAMGHADLIEIHPFVDGNGRWARAVTAAFIRDCGFAYGTVFVAARKREYVAALDRAILKRECGDLRRLIIDGMRDQLKKRQGYKLKGLR